MSYLSNENKVLLSDSTDYETYGLQHYVTYSTFTKFSKESDIIPCKMRKYTHSVNESSSKGEDQRLGGLFPGVVKSEVLPFPTDLSDRQDRTLNDLGKRLQPSVPTSDVGMCDSNDYPSTDDKKDMMNICDDLPDYNLNADILSDFQSAVQHVLSENLQNKFYHRLEDSMNQDSELISSLSCQDSSEVVTISSDNHHVSNGMVENIIERDNISDVSGNHTKQDVEKRTNDV